MVIRGINSQCWSCGHPVDSATGVDSKGVAAVAPDEGDCTICIACGEWSIFNKDLTIRKPTEAEFFEIGFDDLCQQLRAAWVASRKYRDG